jgi:hypothetical protein
MADVTGLRQLDVTQRSFLGKDCRYAHCILDFRDESGGAGREKSCLQALDRER